MNARPTHAVTAEVPRLEDKTIQPIPAHERHGKARDLFTIWFGSNIMIMTIVTGGLATTVFGLSFVPAIVGIIIGNVVGGIFMALHSAQGPQLGVAQMIQTRGQFGSYGALLIVVIVVVMYVGFFAANLVFGGQALAAVSPGISVDAGIIIIGVLSVVATIFGYRLIHAYARILSIVAGLALVLAFVWILAVHGLPASFLEQGNFTWAGFMGAVSVSADRGHQEDEREQEHAVGRALRGHARRHRAPRRCADGVDEQVRGKRPRRRDELVDIPRALRGSGGERGGEHADCIDHHRDAQPCHDAEHGAQRGGDRRRRSLRRRHPSTCARWCSR